MKPFTVCLLVLGALPAFAGKVVTYDVVDLATNAVTKREILVDALGIRINDGNTSAIFLGDRMLIVDNSRGQYNEINTQTVTQLGQQSQSIMDIAMSKMDQKQKDQFKALMARGGGGPVPNITAPVARTTYTEKGQGTVGTFSCRNYDATNAGQKTAELCAAPFSVLNLSAAETQMLDKMREFAAAMANAARNAFGAPSMSSLAVSGVDGFPVQETSFTAGRPARRETVTSIADRAFTPADFSPGTARKVDLVPQGKGR